MTATPWSALFATRRLYVGGRRPRRRRPRRSGGPGLGGRAGAERDELDRPLRARGDAEPAGVAAFGVHHDRLAPPVGEQVQPAPQHQLAPFVTRQPPDLEHVERTDRGAVGLRLAAVAV